MVAFLVKGMKAAFSFIHHPRKKARHKWYESLFWGSLAITLIGSFLVLLGQFAAIILPLYIGPDVSDYNLVCDPVHFEISVQDIYPHHIFKLSAINLHPLKNYTRQIYVSILAPPGFFVSSYNPVMYAGQSTYVIIFAEKYKLNYGKPFQPIFIQGNGADGKMRNCTIIAEVNSTVDPTKPSPSINPGLVNEL